MKILLLGSAEISDYTKLHQKFDQIICCDGGIKHAHHLNIMPDLILGDFDSAEQSLLAFYKEKHVPFQSFSVNKDETDMDLGLAFAISLSPDEITIAGGVGNRFDHTLANVHLLYKALQNGVKAILLNGSDEIHLIDKSIVLQGFVGETLSLLPLSMEVTGVTTHGLQYPLENFTLKLGSTRCVSNVFQTEIIRVDIQSGFLLVIRSCI